MIENKDYVIKKRSDGTELVIKEIDYHVAKEMIIKNHYSKKWNTPFGRYNYGIFKDDRLLGVAVYGYLMNPKSATNIVESGKVIELNRLWVDDELGHNTETMMLSATFTLLKNNTDYEAIQSFADGRLGCGTIYKASNFKYYGHTESVFFEHVETGEVFHQALLDNTRGPRQFLLLNMLKMQNKLIPFKVKTYRYIIPLKKKVKIKMKELPYPEYDIGYEYIENRFPIGVVSRLFNMYEVLDFDPGMKLSSDTLKKYYEIDEILDEIERQKTNKSYIWFINEYSNKNGLLKELKEQSGIDIQLSVFDFLEGYD